MQNGYLVAERGLHGEQSRPYKDSDYHSTPNVIRRGLLSESIKIRRSYLNGDISIVWTIKTRTNDKIL
jgi:hypothetical protein